MKADQQMTFDRYHLDLSNEQVWRGQQAIPLTSQSFC